MPYASREAVILISSRQTPRGLVKFTDLRTCLAPSAASPERLGGLLGRLWSLLCTSYFPSSRTSQLSLSAEGVFPTALIASPASKCGSRACTSLVREVQREGLATDLHDHARRLAEVRGRPSRSRVVSRGWGRKLRKAESRYAEQQFEKVVKVETDGQRRAGCCKKGTRRRREVLRHCVTVPLVCGARTPRREDDAPAARGRALRSSRRAKTA